MDGGLLPESKTAQAERRKRIKESPADTEEVRVGGRFLFVIEAFCLRQQAGQVWPHSYIGKQCKCGNTLLFCISKQGRLHELLKKSTPPARC